ncbi:zinc ribbon domain-containing protein [Prosthecobacter sp.]|uniref:zinc ribbon domain-containing protein n=1 Tax=Prosthecobacter sp. TaxID=1965333 RepID=UPI002AB94ECA|nr:zinc ribbon domain-containing protein [Prosthecobacter sp.]MDZ4403186.1 zinc ribbon domain-containing protein [Prosthecobacter sp.]
MFCPKCGRQYADEAKFCPGCGASNRRAAAPPPLPGAMPAQEPVSKIVRDEPQHARQAQATPPPLAPQQEEELVLPPPASGMTISFRANPHGRMERMSDRPQDGPAPATTSTGTAGGVNAAAMLAAASVDCALPPQTSMWAFRVQTSALADKIAGSFSAQAGGQMNPFIEGAGRLVRGALMHKDVYRAAASRGSLMTEAICTAALLIVISTIGLRIGSLFGYGSSFTIKLMVIRVLSWVGSVFAVHWVAKTQQKVDLPPAAWFRAMVYAQAGLVLTLVPALGILVTLWVAVCTVAALQDVSGKDTTAGIILLVVAGVASTVIASVIGSVLI